MTPIYCLDGIQQSAMQSPIDMSLEQILDAADADVVVETPAADELADSIKEERRLRRLATSARWRAANPDLVRNANRRAHNRYNEKLRACWAAHGGSMMS
jgi:hypothetical protein